MTRSDGEFPKYSKLKLDPNNWPDHYWDVSFECSRCKRHWPFTISFNPTPCCGAQAARAAEPPDMRWPEAIKALNEFRFERFYRTWNEEVTDEQLCWEDIKTNGEVDQNKLSKEIDSLLGDLDGTEQKEESGTLHREQ